MAKYLQGLVGLRRGNAVAYLTLAKQHSIDCIKGHHFEVSGYGSFSLLDIKGTITQEVLQDKFLEARNQIWKEQ